MRLLVSKTLTFAASHRLPNLPHGHQCGHLHGHNYEVHFVISGRHDCLDMHTGMLYDFTRFDAVKALLDHRDLNEVFGERNDAKAPTVENLSLFLHEWLAADLAMLFPYPESRPRVERVEVSETATSRVVLVCGAD